MISLYLVALLQEEYYGFENYSATCYAYWGEEKGGFFLRKQYLLVMMLSFIGFFGGVTKFG